MIGLCPFKQFSPCCLSLVISLRLQEVRPIICELVIILDDTCGNFPSFFDHCGCRVHCDLLVSLSRQFCSLSGYFPFSLCYIFCLLKSVCVPSPCWHKQTPYILPCLLSCDLFFHFFFVVVAREHSLHNITQQIVWLYYGIQLAFFWFSFSVAKAFYLLLCTGNIWLSYGTCLINQRLGKEKDQEGLFGMV